MRGEKKHPAWLWLLCRNRPSKVNQKNDTHRRIASAGRAASSASALKDVGAF